MSLTILCINGIITPEPVNSRLWGPIAEEFADHYPDATFRIEHLLYGPHNIVAMRAFIAELVARYDHAGDHLIIIGHSMGGIIALAAEPRFAKSKVLAVVTVFSPITYIGAFYPLMLGAHKISHTAKIFSFAATHDLFVPYGARHPQADHHEDVFSTHILFPLVSNQLAKRITAAVVRTLSRTDARAQIQ